MPTSIGPHFGEELAVAGVLGLPFSWNPATAQFNLTDPRLTPAQITTINAVIAAHNPSTPATKKSLTGTVLATDVDTFTTACNDMAGNVLLSQELRNLGTVLPKLLKYLGISIGG